MKIYPGENPIMHTKDVTVNHIPLAYVSEQYQNKEIIINIEKEFCDDTIEENVYPYQAFENKDIVFFDKNNNGIESAPYLRRNGNKYYFEPKDSTEFIPTEFLYSVLVNKSDVFKSNTEYKMNIASFSPDMAENLIGIFNENNKDKPSNIHINNDNQTPMGMLDMKFKEADILFVPKDIFERDREYMEELLDNHVNIWIVGDNFINKSDLQQNKFVLDSPQLYNTPEYVAESEDKYVINFDLNKEAKGFSKEKYDYISVFDSAIPILIIKKENGGFVMMSDKNLIKNSDTYGKLILEISMLIYLNSYFATNERKLSITDQNIDFYVKMYMPFNQSHPRVNLEDILYEDGFNLDIEYNIVTANFNREDIKYLGVNRYKDLLFKKTSKTDPIKEDETISVYTANGTVVNYNKSKNVIKIIEDKLEICGEQGYIRIAPFRSTKRNVILKKEQSIVIPDENEYVLFWTGQNFDIITSSAYDVKIHGTKFATLKQTRRTELKVSDLRLYGGGECCDKENYEMIDTGALEGRPYRLGSTMIIRLPERFRDKEKIILSEVKKHISSAEYPILLFKD